MINSYCDSRSAIASSFTLRPCPQRLQGVDLTASTDPSPTPLETPLTLPRLAVHLLEGHKPDIIHREGLLALGRQEVVGDVAQVGLGARGPQLAVVAQVVQLGGVVLEEAGELLGLEQLLAELARAGLADGDARHGPQRVVHAVPERVDLPHVERVVLDVLAQLRLRPPHPRQHLLVAPGRLDARRHVLPELVPRDREREAHARLPRPRRPPDPVLVALRGRGEVEVDDRADVLEIYAPGHAVLVVPGGFSFLLGRGIFLGLILAVRIGPIASFILVVFLAKNFGVVTGNYDIVDVPVEFFDNVYSRAYGELGV